MTDREAIEILQEEHRYCQEPCYVINAISAAISALKERIGREQNEPLTLDELREMRGKWIRNNIDNPAFFICSQCGIVWYNETNYCPNCGAKMDLKKESYDTEEE